MVKHLPSFINKIYHIQIYSSFINKFYFTYGKCC